MKRTNQQSARLHQLLATCGLMDDKANLVSAYTYGRATSSTELTESEARALIQHLEQIEAQVRPAAPDEDVADKQRKKILSLAHEMRWTLASNPARVDMARVEAWCREKSFGRKPLNAYTLAELPKLVSQFKIVYEKNLADLAAGR